jgi:peptide deformylase
MTTEQQIAGGREIMRIAIPMADGLFCEHFGAAKQFLVARGNRQTGEVLDHSLFEAPAHAPGTLPRWLAQADVDAVVASTIGERALIMLADAGIRVFVAPESRQPLEQTVACLSGELPPAKLEDARAADDHHSERRLSLVLYPDDVLRSVCDPVATFDSELQDLADEMLALMVRHQGIGLAAPQVGLQQRLIVCRLGDCGLALANPEVGKAAEPRNQLEGCLSLPGVEVNVRRLEEIRLAGYDLHGKRKSFRALGLWARVIQHEIDHLNGVLISDYQEASRQDETHCPPALPPMLLETNR